MKRREFLWASAAGVAGLGLSGCLEGGPNAVWQNGIYLRGITVADGRMYGLGSDPEEDGERIYALDIGTGAREWGYRSTESYGRSHTGYTYPAVKDGVYFNRRGPGERGGVHALDLDGEERWMKEIHKPVGSPVVEDNVVYATISGGYIQGFDADNGDPLWRGYFDYDSQFAPEIEGVSDGRLYVTTHGDLYALDTEDDGRQIWKYDTGAPHVDSVELANDNVYLTTRNGVEVIRDGDEVWSREIQDVDRMLVGEENVYIVQNRSNSYDYRLTALHPEFGERWVKEPGEAVTAVPKRVTPSMLLRNNKVYLGSRKISVLDQYGVVEPEVELKDGYVETMSVSENGNIYAGMNKGRIQAFEASGERIEEIQLPYETDAFRDGSNHYSYVTNIVPHDNVLVSVTGHSRGTYAFTPELTGEGGLPI